MKLERISENQIRCTLTRSDLAERELKISELAYGTEKAKALFREMMVQASDELGFEADNIPLIIEAVPVSNECIMLIVTKVEDPEELDTRFSKFTPSPEDTEDLSDTDDEIYSSADDILDIFKRLGSDILSKTAELHSISGTADLPSDTETTSDDASSEDEEPQKTILRILNCFSGNKCHIMGTCIMIRVMKTVGIDKMCIRTAKCLRTLIHQVAESTDGAADKLGGTIADFIGR